MGVSVLLYYIFAGYGRGGARSCMEEHSVKWHKSVEHLPPLLGGGDTELAVTTLLL